jgi:K+-transporting ATPase KdpF subunit
MLDIVFLLGGLAFFGLAAGYAALFVYLTYALVRPERF